MSDPDLVIVNTTDSIQVTFIGYLPNVVLSTPNTWSAKQALNAGYAIGTVNYIDGGSNSTNVDGEIRIVDNADPSVTTLVGVHHADPTKRILATDSGSDTFNRFYIDGNGGLSWGPGNLIQDTSMLRLSAGVLGVNGALTILASSSVPAGGGAGEGLQFGSVNNFFGIYFGSGVPNMLAGKGSLYLRTDGSSGSTRMYVNSGTGITNTWVAVTTAS